MDTAKEILYLMSGALTPVIAIIAAYIAYQQYNINQLRLRHELYERRLRVYKSVQFYLSEIMRDGDVEFQRCAQFYADASEAVFLFGTEIQEYVEQLYSKGIDLHSFQEQLYPSDSSPGLPVGQERSKVAKDKGELLKWLIHELSNSKEFFRKHMGVQ